MKGWLKWMVIGAGFFSFALIFDIVAIGWIGAVMIMLGICVAPFIIIAEILDWVLPDSLAGYYNQNDSAGGFPRESKKSYSVYYRKGNEYEQKFTTLSDPNQAIFMGQRCKESHPDYFVRVTSSTGETLWSN